MPFVVLLAKDKQGEEEHAGNLQHEHSRHGTIISDRPVLTQGYRNVQSLENAQKCYQNKYSFSQGQDMKSEQNCASAKQIIIHISHYNKEKLQYYSSIWDFMHNTFLNSS